jgi:hypothetical protein
MIADDENAVDYYPCLNRAGGYTVQYTRSD